MNNYDRLESANPATECPNCGATSPGGRYCARCDASITRAKELRAIAHAEKPLNCPRCDSQEYGYDLSENGTQHWSCLNCKIGIAPDSRHTAGYNEACGYWN